MSPSVDLSFVPRPVRPSLWRGRSGRQYELTVDSISSFNLRDDTFSVIAEGPHVLWVGTARDVVEDNASRTRLRLALKSADRAYSFPAPVDGLSRISMASDIETAAPLTPTAAAA